MRNEIVEKHYRKHFQHLCKVVSFRRKCELYDAEDILHTAYEKALRYFNAWDSRISTFDTWFGRILVNCEKDYQRDQRLKGAVIDDSKDIYSEEDFVVLFGAVDSSQNPQDSLDKLRSNTDLLWFIDTQKGDYQEVLRLYYIHQYSLAEIHSITNFMYKKVDNIIKDFRLRFIKAMG